MTPQHSQPVLFSSPFKHVEGPRKNLFVRLQTERAVESFAFSVCDLFPTVSEVQSENYRCECMYNIIWIS